MVFLFDLLFDTRNIYQSTNYLMSIIYNHRTNIALFNVGHLYISPTLYLSIKKRLFKHTASVYTYVFPECKLILKQYTTHSICQLTCLDQTSDKKRII